MAFLELLTPSGTRCALPSIEGEDGHRYVSRKNGTPKKASGTGVLSEIKGERFGVVAAQVYHITGKKAWRCTRTCDDPNCVALAHYTWILRKP